MTPKRRYDPEAARQDILDAAEQAFQDKGFGGVSTAAIARAAGVSQSQIHYHFDTKRNLYVAVFERRFGEYFAAQSKLLEGDEVVGLARLEASIRAYFRFFQRNTGFARLMMRAYLDHDDKDDRMSGELLQSGAAVIAEAQQRGDLRSDVPAEYILLSFLSMVSQWFVSREHHLADLAEGESPEDHDEAYLDTILKIFLRGVAPVPQD